MSEFSGFGRGGRGAALRQALEQTKRKPGERAVKTEGEGSMPPLPTDPMPQPPSLPPGAPSMPPTTPPPVRQEGRGRASLLQLLQQQPTPTQSTSPGGPIPMEVTPSRPHPPSMGATPPSATSISKKDVLPSEARQGSQGTRIQLKLNYVKMITTTEYVFQYTVTYSPVIDSNNVRFALMTGMKDVIGNTRAFDGSTLYLPVLVTDSTISKQVRNERTGDLVEVSITLVKKLYHEDCPHLMNILFKRAMKQLKLKQIGRNSFDPSGSVRVPQHKLELWPGYVTSIARKDGGLMLMMDVSHKVLRDESVLDFFYDLYAHHQHGFQEEATKQLVGSVVLTRYNNRTYRVDDIAWDKNPRSSFTNSAGQSILFKDYYKNQYNLTISDEEQPLLIHRPRKRSRPNEPTQVGALGGEERVICLVPELCNMTGLTDAARSDFRVMKDIAAYTKITPQERELSFKKFISNLQGNPAAMKEITSWGLQLGQDNLAAKGRILPQEKIIFQGRSIQVGTNGDFGREAMQEAMLTAVPLRSWIVICTKKDNSRAFEFINMVKRVSPPLGMEVANPTVKDLKDDRTDAYLQAIRESLHSGLQLVLCIFPTMRDDRYSAVKKMCCCEQPVPSQCINSRTLGNPQKLKAITQKIVLQINAKLGGELWSIEVPLKNIMLIGVDVFHKKGSRSVAGFVASTNRQMTRWFSRVIFQSEYQELMTGLQVCLSQALNKYHESNGTFPDRIIVFRDGVSQGQLSQVTDLEIPQLLECFKAYGDQYKPKFAMIVVQKRISTRMMASVGNQLRNPPPGSLLDHTITTGTTIKGFGGYDFFLVSQNVREGTVTPSHYHVVYNTSGLKPDHIQRLAYKMTFMYYNWPGTIRVPAPCQYAHKLAYMVGQSLLRDPSVELSDRLFFL